MLALRKCARISGVYPQETGKLCRSRPKNFESIYAHGGRVSTFLYGPATTTITEVTSGVQPYELEDYRRGDDILEKLQPTSVFLVRKNLLLACTCIFSGIPWATRFLRYASCCAPFQRHRLTINR